MAFQILKDNKPIPMNVVNKEIGELWDKYNLTYPVTPYQVIPETNILTDITVYLFEGVNWADKLLYLSDTYGSSSFETLIVDLQCDIHNKVKSELHYLDSSFKYNQPYFDMIEHLISKGYVFKYINNNELLELND